MRTADPTIPTNAQARELLARVIQGSGLSARAWAESIGRDERTVRRWISGEILIPLSTLDYLKRADGQAGDVALVRDALESPGLGERRRLLALEAFGRLHPAPVEVSDPEGGPAPSASEAGALEPVEADHDLEVR